MQTKLKINDAHMHLGQFNDIYATPKQLMDFADAVGIESFAVSSSTTCEEDYPKIFDEMSELVQIAGTRLKPILWITPKMLESDYLQIFLDNIKWSCIKIHPYMQQDAWSNTGENMKKVLGITKQLDVPLLIHTGGCESADAGNFGELAENNPHQKIILAHGRPIDQTIDVMSKNENVWADTAFMPTEHIVKLVENGFTDRILWGSDYHIPLYFYKDRDIHDYYANLIKEIQNSISKTDFQKIIYNNFINIFKN